MEAYASSLARSVVQLQAMLAGHSTQIAFQRAIQHHLRVLERNVIDEPVELGAHGQSGVEAVLVTGGVYAEDLAVGIAQLDAGGVDVESARYQFFHLFLLSPGPQARPGVPECVPEPGLILVYLLS